MNVYFLSSSPILIDPDSMIENIELTNSTPQTPTNSSVSSYEDDYNLSDCDVISNINLKYNTTIFDFMKSLNK